MDTTNDAIAAFLAKGGKITKCAPAEGNATPLRKLRARADAAIEAGQGDDGINVLARRGAETVDPSRVAREDFAIENAAERRAERFGAARADGWTVSNALDYANE
jgi:hypothetical protein